jgi:mono/diheme cytochrome c family protein
MIMRVIALLVMGMSLLVQADTDLPSQLLNRDSVVNTRHNMTQRQEAGGSAISLTMGPYRNDYGEVCVYCHTPHAGNTITPAPLWNRTMKASFYTNYNSTSLDGTIVAPGVNSLTCLSCHDGVTAIDSIINMPGSGGFMKSQETMQNDDFLDTWDNAQGPDATQHMGLKLGPGQSCLECHSSFAGLVGTGASDFIVFAVGTELFNDHPVGVPYRDPSVYPGADYRVADRIGKSMRFFDTDGDGRADPDEIRFYDSGNGFRVECASCHDPHGVPAKGGGPLFNKTFMRITNEGSKLCLTCHIK